MWWIIGTVAFLVMLFCYCSCVLAGRADDQKDEWMSRKEEGTMKSIPSERDPQFSRGSGACPPPEPSTLPLFDSRLVGFRERI